MAVVIIPATVTAAAPMLVVDGVRLEAQGQVQDVHVPAAGRSNDAPIAKDVRAVQAGARVFTAERGAVVRPQNLEHVPGARGGRQGPPHGCRKQPVSVVFAQGAQAFGQQTAGDVHEVEARSSAQQLEPRV